MVSKRVLPPEKPLPPTGSVNDIPSFASEDEEAAYWSTHGAPADLLAAMGPIDDERLPTPRTRPVSLRLDEHTLKRARALAARRNVGYQTLIKDFINERLYEEEKREGLIGERR